MSVSRFAGQATKDFRGINLPTITDFMPGKEDYGATASQGISERGETQATSLTEQARMMATGIGAQAAVKGAKYEADAIRAGGSAQGRASMFSGIAEGVGSLAGGAIKRSKYPTGGSSGLGGFGSNQYSSYGIDYNSEAEFSQNPLDGLSFSNSRL